jgi:glucosamine--fructose-6-phosphate aminotransferase (isomerizing)
MSNYTAGSFLFDETSSQDRAWAELIPLVLNQRQAIRNFFKGIEAVIFSGCGSALNVSYSAAPLFQMLTGLSAWAVPAADTTLFPRAYLPADRKTAAVLLSRSGQTTEVVNSLETFQGLGIRVMGITCTADSPLSQASDLSLVLTPVIEQAVATTRSLTGMILAAQLVSGILAGQAAYLDELHRLPEVFADRKEEFLALGKSVGEQAGLARFAVVGNGPFYGLAREGQLKIKEMTLLPADAYPMFDFRHGPQSNVNPQMLVIAFLSDSAIRQERLFLEDMRALGGELWAIGEQSDQELRQAAQHVLALRSGLSELARLPLYLPAVQYMAYYRAISLGLNPDEPRNLSYWVKVSR